MAARRYKISLRVLKNISRVSAAVKYCRIVRYFRFFKRPCNFIFIILNPHNTPKDENKKTKTKKQVVDSARKYCELIGQK